MDFRDVQLDTFALAREAEACAAKCNQNARRRVEKLCLLRQNR